MSITKPSIASEEFEPQVTSSDPNERKLARRLRIERRNEAIRKSRRISTATFETEVEAEKEDAILAQMKKSAEVLEKCILEGEEYITNVKIANESREVDRRESEGLNKDKVYEQLDEEAHSANELFEQIADKWASIQRHNDPLQINESILMQKEKCDMLISQKDAIIAMLNDELKKAERQFTKDQRKQIEDINTLSHRIEKQISFMRKAYQNEIAVIEEVINGERGLLIEVSDKKWDELYRKREQQESSNCEAKLQQVEDFTRRMDLLRMDFQEHFRETRINLENDIEELQRELEKIKALALLNSEKLDYNYQILKKREDENIIIKSQQKRRMNKLQDVINDLRNEISDYETSTSNKIKKLSENIKKMHKSIIDIEAKADHFAQVNDEKFHRLWEMNKSRVFEVLNRILQTDQILYEQQMGISWERPPSYTLELKTLPSYKSALNLGEPQFAKGHSGEKLEKTRLIDSSSIMNIVATDIGYRDSFMGIELIDSYNNYKRVIKHILTRIADKSGFLAERRLNELLKGYTTDQKHLVRLDNVFAALGIQGTKYLSLLFKHFQPYTFCPVCQGTVAPDSADGVRSSTSRTSFYSRYGLVESSENLLELEDVMNAVRQPDTIVTALISELVADDLNDDDVEEVSGSDVGIKEICGEARDFYKPEKSKEKAHGTLKTRHLSEVKPDSELRCEYRHPLLISPVYILRALREFVASYYIAKVGLPTTKARLEKKRLTTSRSLTEYDIKTYWEKIKMNFGQDRVDVWGALLNGLKKYNAILRDRKAICDDVLRLRKENAELKRLLANYLDHHEFMTPPCAKERLE